MIFIKALIPKCRLDRFKSVKIFQENPYTNFKHLYIFLNLNIIEKTILLSIEYILSR